eukprot:1147799-Karenia_brevis.AAC.1
MKVWGVDVLAIYFCEARGAEEGWEWLVGRTSGLRWARQMQEQANAWACQSRNGYQCNGIIGGASQGLR